MPGSFTDDVCDRERPAPRIGGYTVGCRECALMTDGTLVCNGRCFERERPAVAAFARPNSYVAVCGCDECLAKAIEAGARRRRDEVSQSFRVVLPMGELPSEDFSDTRELTEQIRRQLYQAVCGCPECRDYAALTIARTIGMRPRTMGMK